MSQQEKCIWDKLSESAKDTILDNIKTPHKPSTHAEFHDVTLGYLINNVSHQFDLGETPNGTSDNDLITKDHHPYNDGDNNIIITNL